MMSGQESITWMDPLTYSFISSNKLIYKKGCRTDSLFFPGNFGFFIGDWAQHFHLNRKTKHLKEHEQKI
jgi:hypothetical protein